VTADAPALPGVLAEIAEVAGRDAAIRVALELGGAETHLPKARYLAQHPEHPLFRVLTDASAALRVAERVGGGSVYIPMAHRACAVHLAAAGEAAPAIAARLGIAVTTARRYMRGA